MVLHLAANTAVQPSPGDCASPMIVYRSGFTMIFDSSSSTGASPPNSSESESDSRPSSALERGIERTVASLIFFAHRGRGVVSGRLVWNQSLFVDVAELRTAVNWGLGDLDVPVEWWMMRPADFVSGVKANWELQYL